MKLCKDCHHYVNHETYPDDPRYAKCSRLVFNPARTSPVDGSRIPPDFWFCDIARGSGPCGIEAKFFERRLTDEEIQSNLKQIYDEIEREKSAVDGHNHTTYHF